MTSKLTRCHIMFMFLCYIMFTSFIVRITLISFFFSVVKFIKLTKGVIKISCCDKVLSKITFHIIILASSYAKLHVFNRFVRKRRQNQPPSTINIKSCLLQNFATTKSWTYVHARMLTLITPPSLASATANS